MRKIEFKVDWIYRKQDSESNIQYKIVTHTTYLNPIPVGGIDILEYLIITLSNQASEFLFLG